MEDPQQIDPDASYKVVTYKARDLPERYWPLIFSRWLRSLRYGNINYRKIPPDYYFKFYKEFLERLMSKPDSLIKLAVLSDDIVLGFSVSREDVLDYIHVHTNNRKQGIAKSLLPEKVTAFSHITKDAAEIWQNPKYKPWQFNPFA